MDETCMIANDEAEAFLLGIPRNSPNKLLLTHVMFTNLVYIPNIVEDSIVIIPILDRAHWTVAVWRVKSRTITHYDSMSNGSLSDNSQQLLDRIGQLYPSLVRNKITVTKHALAVQRDGVSCGVFACLIAEHHLRNDQPLDVMVLRNINIEEQRARIQQALSFRKLGSDILIPFQPTFDGIIREFVTKFCSEHRRVIIEFGNRPVSHILGFNIPRLILYPLDHGHLSLVVVEVMNNKIKHYEPSSMILPDLVLHNLVGKENMQIERFNANIDIKIHYGILLCMFVMHVVGGTELVLTEESIEKTQLYMIDYLNRPPSTPQSTTPRDLPPFILDGIRYGGVKTTPKARLPPGTQSSLRGTRVRK